MAALVQVRTAFSFLAFRFISSGEPISTQQTTSVTLIFLAFCFHAMGAYRWMCVRLALDAGDVTFRKPSCGDYVGPMPQQPPSSQAGVDSSRNKQQRGGGGGGVSSSLWWGHRLGGLFTGRPASVVPVQALLGATMAVLLYGICSGKLQKPRPSTRVSAVPAA